MARRTNRQIAADRKAAENQLATLRLQAETTAMQRTLALLESPQPVQVPWSEYPAFDSFGGWPPGVDKPFFWTSIDDRTEGRYRPLYENASDLRKMRADARRLVAFFPVAKVALEALTNYTIKNFSFSVQSKIKGAADQLAKAVQPIVDRFLEHNEFSGKLDRTVHSSSREDGEVFMVLHPDGQDVRIDVVDPSFVLEPANGTALERMLNCGHRLNYWWHGVHTCFNKQLKRDDVTRPLGYHFVYDPLGDQWDYLPAVRVQHIKRNVGPESRRGVSDFAIALGDIEREAKIRRNTAEGAAILAAIVMIREHAEGVSRSTIESMVSSNATSSFERTTASGGAATVYGQQAVPGTVKDIPHGMKAMMGPMGTLNQPIYVQVSQYLLRVIGQRWAMPEYMISGDASNANYSSTLVSESPFVKAREHDQEFYAAHFIELIWKALAMYYRGGVLRVGSWQQLRESVKIVAEYASPASRNRTEIASANKVLADAGILSKRTWAGDADLDYDEEQANIAAEPKPKTPPQLLPFTATQQPRGTEFRTESLAIRAIDVLMDRKRGGHADA